jgi:PAS domain-containing protein
MTHRLGSTGVLRRGGVAFLVAAFDAGPGVFDVSSAAGALLVLTWCEVSSRQRTETELAGLAAIVRSSHDAIVSIDADLRITSWNRGAEAMYGYRAEEVLGKPSEFMVPPRATLASRKLR